MEELQPSRNNNHHIDKAEPKVFPVRTGDGPVDIGAHGLRCEKCNTAGTAGARLTTLMAVLDRARRLADCFDGAWCRQYLSLAGTESVSLSSSISILISSRPR